MEGYTFNHVNQVATVWSAPNYHYRVGNRATVLRINGPGDVTKENFIFFDADPKQMTEADLGAEREKACLDYFV